MNIDVTVANEDRLIALFRERLRGLARSLVADDPQRVGKHYARVWMPDDIVMAPHYSNGQRPRIEFV